MVEVICENNKVKCKTCRSILQFQESDVEFCSPGGAHVVCPVCGQKVYLPPEFDRLITLDNVNYPKHFYSSESGVEVANGVIQTWIDEAAEYLRLNPEEAFYTIKRGNSTLIVLNFEDEYRFIVAQDYEEVDILKENNN